MSMKIYIAASFDARERALTLAGNLMLQGHEITSRWLFGDIPGTKAEIAQVDLDDVDRADAVLELSAENGERVRGGKFYEAGYARGKGKKVYLLGNAEHIFHELSEVWS